jgi:hypothetical protein
MRNTPKNSTTENMHSLLEGIFVDYANRLRRQYPDQTIRNAAVFASAVKAFSRHGYIQLAHAGRGIIPSDLPNFIVRTIKRAKHQPIWIPTRNLPRDYWGIFEQMKPTLRGKKIEWLHTPAREVANGRKK